MSAASVDCPPCPWCTLPVAAPQMADSGGHAWDGRHRTYDPRALWCCSCGAAWIEANADAVARAWKAQGAWYAENNPDEAPGLTREGAGHCKVDA